MCKIRRNGYVEDYSPRALRVFSQGIRGRKHRFDLVHALEIDQIIEVLYDIALVAPTKVIGLMSSLR